MLTDKDAAELRADNADREIDVAPMDEEVKVMPEQSGTSVSVQLSEGQFRALQERAAQLGISVDDLIWVAIQDLLRSPSEEFRRNAEYVLEENAELYRRLA